jgi:hypothetical protein
MDRILLIDLLLVAFTLVLFMAVFFYLGWEIHWVRHHGRRIVATITDIRYGIGNSPTRFSRDHPYVTAKWTDPGTGRSYTFWKLAAEDKPPFKIGNLVPVLIDPNHPKYYEMEI